MKTKKNTKAFIDYSQEINDVYVIWEDSNSTKKRKVLIVFDDMTRDTKANKKLTPIDIELSSRDRKLNILLVFISQSYFKVPKTIRMNATHYFIMKITNTRELKQIGSNHSSDNNFKDFMKLYKDYTKKPY